MTALRIVDALDSRDFYEMCQAYRHARDVSVESSAAAQFEALKAWIRDNAIVCERPSNSPYAEDAA